MTDARQRIDVGEAVELIAANMPAYPTQRVPLAAATGQILREPIVAERDQPPFNRVTMDGIAIRHDEFAQGQRRFVVRGTQAAGAESHPIGNGAACVEIMTGAALPDDADTIVPVERTKRDGDFVEIESDYPAEPGQFIHACGSDYRADTTLLTAGTLIRAPEAAVLTAAGREDVAIAAWPRVVAIATGDELVNVGAPLNAFQIRSSNDRAIAASLESHGARAVTRAHLTDDADQLAQSIARLHDEHDLLVLSGGVSMGKYDFVPATMAKLGMRLVFHKILQRPGLPMWFGISRTGKPVFALPGNPVSSLVCLTRYVVPAILAALGLAERSTRQVPLGEAFRSDVDLTRFVPVCLRDDDNGQQIAIPVHINTSGDFSSLAGTDGIVELARERSEFPRGYVAPFFAW